MGAEIHFKPYTMFTGGVIHTTSVELYVIEYFVNYLYVILMFCVVKNCWREIELVVFSGLHKDNLEGSGGESFVGTRLVGVRGDLK